MFPPIISNTKSERCKICNEIILMYVHFSSSCSCATLLFVNISQIVIYVLITIEKNFIPSAFSKNYQTYCRCIGKSLVRLFHEILVFKFFILSATHKYINNTTIHFSKKYWHRVDWAFPIKTRQECFYHVSN